MKLVDKLLGKVSKGLEWIIDREIIQSSLPNSIIEETRSTIQNHTEETKKEFLRLMLVTGTAAAAAATFQEGYAPTVDSTTLSLFNTWFVGNCAATATYGLTFVGEEIWDKIKGNSKSIVETIEDSTSTFYSTCLTILSVDAIGDTVFFSIPYSIVNGPCLELGGDPFYCGMGGTLTGGTSYSLAMAPLMPIAHYAAGKIRDTYENTKTSISIHCNEQFIDKSAFLLLEQSMRQLI